MAFIADGPALGCRTYRDSGPKHGRFGLGEWNHPRYRPPPWKVQHMIPEPSAIWGINVEGPALDTELSTISTSSVEGSTLEPRTAHDSGPKRGRSSFGHRTIRDIDLQRGRSSPEPRTIRDIDLQRGRFNTWIPNHPRYVAPTVEGPAPEPRTIRAEAPNRGRFAPSK